MIVATERGINAWEASIILADGTEAGSGYGYSRYMAVYFACRDAILNRHPQAACGHAVELNAEDEAVVRRLAGAAQL